jgi:putative ABC transport system ATP-binding protein
MMADNVIDMQDVSKTYRLGETKVHALRSVSFALASGEIVALEGPSGSGKSTVLNICGLLDKSDSGTLHIQGNDIATFSARQCTLFRRDAIGFIFQSFNLIPVMTAFENVEYPLLLKNVSIKERQHSVNAVLERVGLQEFAKHLPDRLSGGQRQRIAIARALVKRPSLVIADEPTASLDTQTAANIVDIMRELSNEMGTSFLVATHDERMAKHCERRVKLVDGRMQ